MNFLKKAAYRCHQAVMRLAIPLLPYREPQLIESTRDIAPLLKSKGISKALLVAGKTVRARGLTDELEAALREYKIEYAVYDGTVPDPTTENVEEAVSLYLERGCEAIIAVGGGSAMDCAKAVGARIARPNKPLSGMRGLLKIRKKIPLFIAVPTTAGTGSEATVAAVITDGVTHQKYAISDFCLIPHYAVLDPRLTVCMPRHLTATTGMDALTHAIEAYVGRARTSDTGAAATEAVRLIFENLEPAYSDGENLTARKNMLYASYLAGTAFTRSYVGYVHAVAHTIGARYGISHGLANAVLLPKVLRAYGNAVAKPLASLAFATGIADASHDVASAAELLISHIENMCAVMELPTGFDCIRDEDIPELARLADKEANPLYPVPVLWNSGELEKIYHLAKGEKQ